MAVFILSSVIVVARHYETIGALDHVKKSMSEYIDYSQYWTVTKAAAMGHITLLRRLHIAKKDDKDTFLLRDIEHAMAMAAQNGHLEVVQFLHAKYPQHSKPWCLDNVASNGHLEVLKWLHEHCGNIIYFTPSTFDDAAENGHLEVIKWLHETQSKNCTTRAMDCAARSGWLDIVQWLHENRQEGCTTQAMDWAAKAGHLEVVQWLHQNRHEGWLMTAIDAAAFNGHEHLVRWLYGHCSVVPCSSNAR